MIVDIQFLSAKEAAKELGCTPERVTQLIRAKEINATRVGDLVWVITREEVERFKRHREAGR